MGADLKTISLPSLEYIISRVGMVLLALPKDTGQANKRSIVIHFCITRKMYNKSRNIQCYDNFKEKFGWILYQHTYQFCFFFPLNNHRNKSRSVISLIKSFNCSHILI